MINKIPLESIKNRNYSSPFQSYSFCKRMELEGYDFDIFGNKEAFIVIFRNKGLFPWGFFIDGVQTNNPSIENTKSFIEYIDKYYTENKKIIGLRDVYDFPYPDHQLTIDNNKLEEIYKNLNFSCKETQTIIIDLRKNEDELFSNLKSNSRQQVRKAQKLGVKIIQIKNLEDLKIYHQIRNETRARTGFSSVPFKHFSDNFEILTRNNEMEFFISLAPTGEPLSGQMIVIKNGIARLEGVCISDFEKKNNFFGNDLMQWEMIKLAKSLGCQYIDFVAANQKDNPSIFNFQNRWGGNIIEYNKYTKIYNYPIFIVYKIIKKIKDIYESIKYSR